MGVLVGWWLGAGSAAAGGWKELTVLTAESAERLSDRNSVFMWDALN